MIAPRTIDRPPWHWPPVLYPATESACGHAARRIVEIGPGRGDFLFHLAEQHPDAIIYGIEIKRRRFCNLIERTRARGLANIALIWGDARHALPSLLAMPDTSTPQYLDNQPHSGDEGGTRLALPGGGATQAHLIDVIYVLFPDPWPKRRHTHNRLMGPEFIATCGAHLKHGGELWFVTDAQPYAEAVHGLMTTNAEWASYYPEGMTTDLPNAYPTYFAQKWRAAGRRIYYQRYWFMRQQRSSS